MTFSIPRSGVCPTCTKLYPGCGCKGTVVILGGIPSRVDGTREQVYEILLKRFKKKGVKNTPPRRKK